MLRRTLFVVAFAAVAACVPADEAQVLGSVAFTLAATRLTMQGVPSSITVDEFRIQFERIALSFKTMTIGEVGVPERCSYRGRGARSDVVFDPRFGIVQTFNGIQPTTCPDVGIVLGPPGAGTTLGPGSSGRELSDLLLGSRQAHALIDAIATPSSNGRGSSRPLRIELRFDSERTASRFGGCRAAHRGIQIRESERDEVTVAFGAEHLFREAISTTAPIRVAPYTRADVEYGDGDGVATMDELDRMPLARAQEIADFYQMPDGTTNGTFGDYVRALFRFSFSFRSEGMCVGNEPGEEQPQ